VFPDVLVNTEQIENNIYSKNYRNKRGKLSCVAGNIVETKSINWLSPN
jgi:hypothetical protein